MYDHAVSAVNVYCVDRCNRIFITLYITTGEISGNKATCIIISVSM